MNSSLQKKQKRAPQKGVTVACRPAKFWQGLSVFALVACLLSSCQQQTDSLTFKAMDDGNAYHVVTDAYELEMYPSQLVMKTSVGSWEMNPSSTTATLPEAREEGVLYSGFEADADLLVYDKGTGKAGYDVILAPGGKLETVKFQLASDQAGAAPFIDSEGALLLPLEEGYLKHSPPIAYQEIEGEQKRVSSHFQLEEGLLSFTAAAFDPAYALVIDPEVSFVAQLEQPVPMETAQSVAASSAMMIPADLPWAPYDLNGTEVIMRPGITFVSCGTLLELDDADRFTIGMFDIRNAVPASGRQDVTATTPVWHHPDWTLGQIGNIFGVTMNTKTGDVFAAASANYGAGYFGSSGAVGYGAIGGGTDDVLAAGTVYKIDAVTGAPSVFAQLPQQAFSFTMLDCESGDNAPRTTGPALGNITYDVLRDQYFVANIEDGRIYRLDASGTILDAFDPFALDNGDVGLPAFDEIVYGVAVEPGGGRLFFGGIDNTPGGGAQAGAPEIYSVDLNTDGTIAATFIGTETYQGTTFNVFHEMNPTFHVAIPTGGGASFANDYMYLISSLDFSLDGELVAGIRVGCKNSFFTSYNHWGETSIVQRNNGTNLYNGVITEFDVSVTGDAGPDDGYGGASYYLLNDGSGEVRYVMSSGDILVEQGPHGIAVFSSNSIGSPVTPLGAISYGLAPSGDPKGVGGDAITFSGCINSIDFLASNCDDGTQTLTGSVTYINPPVPLGLITVSVEIDGVVTTTQIDPAVDNTFTFTGLPCSDVAATGAVTATFDNNSSCTYTETYTLPDPPPCELDIEVTQVSQCANGTYTVDGTISSISAPGNITLTLVDNGVTQTLNLPGTATTFQFTGLQCNGETSIQVDASFDDNTACSDIATYDEPTCDLDIAVTSVSACSGGAYTVDGTISATNAPSGDITISLTESGMLQTITVPATATSFQFTGLTCDGDESINVSASFANQADCSDAETYDEPCSLDITDIAITDNCITSGTYDVVVTYTVFNAPGNLSLTADGMTVQVNYNAGDDAVDATATISGLDCSTLTNETFTVTGDLGGGCSDTDTYTAPFLSASLGDQVWEDLDFNGINDPGEPGVEGVTVTLFTCVNGVKDAAVPGGVTMTDASGNYEFTGLVPGDYCVQFDASTSTNPDAADFVFTIQDTGDDVTDSDVDPATANSACVNLTAGENDPTIDAGVYLPASLGDQVWEDIDGDGSNDPTEPGVEGVTVTLFTCVNGVKDAPVPGGITTTDASGNYEFTGLAPGDYCVQFDASTSTDPEAAEFVFTVQDTGDDATDSDVDPATANSSCVNLESGEDDSTVDAGVYVPASLGDQVWEDIDGDGSNDPTEPGVEGVTVTLFTCVNGVKDAPVPGAVTTTDASGNYEFTDLAPGDYCVQFDASTSTDPEAADFVFTVQDTGDDATDSDVDPATANSSCVNLESGEDDPTIDAGVYVPATLGDQVWEDIDGDGSNDPTEPGVEGVTVTLFTCVNGIKDAPVPGAVTTTDASGNYEFTGLAPGDYCVQFDASTSTDPEAVDFVFTVQDTGDDATDSDVDPATANSSCVNLESGEDDPTVDAGVYVPATLGDQVWEDVDGDGSNDPTEPGVEGVTVTLFTCANGVKDAPVPGAVTTTDASGNYEFTGLAPGDYCVQFDASTSTDPEAAAFVFTLQDTGDDATDSDVDPATANSSCVNLESGEDDPTVDAGVYVAASLGDQVWEDIDGDGTNDPTEPGVEGVTVTLFTCVNGVKDAPVPGAVTTTDANGNYEFTGLVPGDYCVQFDASTSTDPEAAEFVFTVQDTGDDATDSDVDPTTANSSCVNLESGEDDSTVDAGVYVPASLGDQVWEDIDGDGSNDPTEPGVEGVTVTLFTCVNGVKNAPVPGGVATTDASGNYEFTDLAPGDYCVQFDASTSTDPEAAEFVFTVQDAGDDATDSDVDPTTANSSCVNLESGEDDPTVDAGVYVPASLGDQVWEDIDGDGSNDPTEPGVEGVTVTLFTCVNGVKDAPVPGAVTTTDASGNYEFTDLAPGDYCVQFDASTSTDPEAAEFVFTVQDTGDDATDSDVDPATANSSCVNLESGEDDPTIDAGVYVPATLGDQVWEDEDYNGTNDPGEPPVEGVTVTLFTCVNGVKDAPVPGAITTTDASGNYEFAGLAPGDYCVQFDLTTANDPNAADMVFTVADAGDDATDSDVDPNTANSSCINLESGEDDPTVDAGATVALDYGDLPDTYSTLASSNGASHSLKPGLYLGSCVDFEPTGAPDAAAGTTGLGGDDLTAGIFSEGNCTGDDEDGITLLTQLIPNTTACIEVTATSTTGSAILNAWIDFNGDGDFAGDANEQLVFTSIGGSSITATTEALVANGTNTTVYCFDVPATATFPTQEAYSRFRLSMNGGLSFAGNADSGEIEDYYTPLAKLGNVVWDDQNGNGLQDDGEPGVEGVAVTITGTDLTDASFTTTVTTDASGMYMFPGLLPGQEYCVNFDYSNLPNASNLIFTPEDVPYNGADAEDSDADMETGDAGCYILAPLEYNQTVDAGIYADDDGDKIPNLVDENSALADPQGLIYCEDSGEIISGGLVEVVAGPGEVEMLADGSTGEYQYFVTQPGTYTIAFTPPAGYLMSSTCLDLGFFDLDPATDGNPILLGASDNNDDNFLDDASCAGNPFYFQLNIEVGEFILRNNIPLSCGEVGDYVWEDNDLDGIQDPNEPPVPGIEVGLYACNGGVKGDLLATTTTDDSGEYLFTGLPGDLEYCVQFDLGASSNPFAGLYFFTEADQTANGGDDTNDSDADPTDGCTTSILLEPGQKFNDFDAGLYLLDFGDLPEDSGYATTALNSGAAHSIPSGPAVLKMGSDVDAETDGQPDPNALGDGLDEDGLSIPMFVTGIPVDIPVNVMNMTGAAAKLSMFADWNDDGDFDDTNEMYSVQVPADATVVTIEGVTPPLTAQLNNMIGIRFRISTDMDAVMSPTGVAPDGEVEDYLAPAMGFDYGDLNDTQLGASGDPAQPLTVADYQTTREDNGASHKIITDDNNNPLLKIGSAVDDEANAITSIDAGQTGGDDNAAAPFTDDPDDEDGLDYDDLPLFILTQTTPVTLPVMNMTPESATVAVFLDMNKDGAFDANTEKWTATVAPNATSVTVNVGPIPADAVVGQDVGLRIRLANEMNEVMAATGLANSGEVEDYFVQIIGFDYGDLPDTYSTTDPDGAKHIISEDLMLGSCVDSELNGLPEPMAGLMQGGDDADPGLATFGTCTGSSDEDGIDFTHPFIPGNQSCVTVTALNMTGEPAVLQMWIDWNGNGVFEGGEEIAFDDATVPDGGVDGIEYCFTVPSTVAYSEGSLFVRTRLSAAGGLTADSQTLPVPFGEIEDYKVKLSKVGSLVWEDFNGNGEQDEDASFGLDAVDVDLLWYGPDGDIATNGDNFIYTVATTTVDGTPGVYNFCGLVPGTYSLSVPTLPTDFVPTWSDIPGDDVIDSDDHTGVELTIVDPMGLPEGESGTGDNPGGINGFPDMQDDLRFDFGAYIPAELGDYVWLDESFAGADDTQVSMGIVPDVPIENVTAMLMGTNNVGVAVTETLLTDENGFYKFTDLAPGSYKVVFDASTALDQCGAILLAVAPNAGGDDTLDSDQDNNFTTGFYALFSGDDNSTVDGGFVEPPFDFGCVANLNVTLGDDCTATITEDMVLTGLYYCIDEFIIDVDGTGTNVVSGCGDHTYMITLIEDGVEVYTCWGDILAEDKTDPVVECLDDVNEVTVDFALQTLQGTLDGTEEVIELNDYSCFESFFEPTDGEYLYDLIEFTVDPDLPETDVYNIQVATNGFGSNFAIFQGGFNADNPCENILGGSDGAYFVDPFFGINAFLDQNFRVALPLQAGQTYTIMITDGLADFGAGTDYIVGIVSDNGGTFSAPFSAPAPVEVTLPLYCEDLDLVQVIDPMTYLVNANGDIVPGSISAELAAILDLTGYPDVSDNCGPVLVTVSDLVESAGDCGDITITRTFLVSDRADGVCIGEPRTDECTQTITLTLPTVADLILPPFTATIECDEEYPTDGEVGGPDDNPHASVTGYPYLLTAAGYVDLSQNYCNLGASYSDEPRINVCEGTYAVRREWNLIDWCAPEDNTTWDQYVKVGDFTGPIISGIDEVITISTSPFSCVANVLIPTPNVVDGNDCGSVLATTYTVLANGESFFAGGNIADGDVVDAPVGTHTLILCAEDACLNETCEEYTLVVRDDIEPTASCDDELNVSIGGGDVLNGVEGIARVFAEDVDEGSSDNCSAVTLEVRRNFWRDGTCDPSASRFSPWGEFVDFYCCDINNEITIELRVTDAGGNQNVCWMTVTPEDKLNPYCYAPEDAELTCAEWPLAFAGDLEAAYENDFNATSSMMSSIFGNATGTDNCAVDTIVERSPVININECGWGSITRRFEAWQLRPEGDVNGNGQIDITEVFRSTNSCAQDIIITEVHDFTIDFPEDADADCGDPEVPTVITSTNGCDVLSVNIGEPVVFSATGDECYKYSITYDVINWCLWDGEYEGFEISRMTEDDGESLPVDRAVEGNERPVVTYTDANGLCIDRRHSDRNGDSSLSNCESPNLPNYGRYIYTQFVKVYDSTAPVVTVGEYGGPTDNCPDLLAGQFGDDDGNCEEAVSIPFSVADDCELFDGDGNLVISIVSAELNAFAVDQNGDGDIKSNEFVVTDNVMGNITDNGDGTYVFAGTFPIIPNVLGDNVFHAVRILFEDGCGNQTSETIVFDVIDCKGPAPICINGLTVTLMPNADDTGCEMAIWASDFEGSPISDCTGQGPDEFLGNPRVTKYAIYRASEAEAPGFVPSPNDTGLVLTQDDEETTILRVYAFDEEGNYDYCETYILVQTHVSCGGEAGTIAGVITTEETEAVEGVEVNLNGVMDNMMMTATDGAYSFGNLPLSGDYTVTPYLNANPLNGVTTFDIIKISQHILNVNSLDSPYKLIAADANRSGTVTTLDMIQIRKLILNITTEFPSNTSWRFVDAAHDFTDWTNPWADAFPELISENNLATDLLDADFVGVKIGDVNGSAQANALAGDDRNLEGVFHLQAEDLALQAGNTYTVAITGENLSQIKGFQGTLQLTGAELLDIEYALAEAGNFGLGFVDQGYVTMSWNTDVPVATDAVLFSLVIHATDNVLLSEVLRINDRYTMAEAYQADQTTELSIAFAEDLATGSVFELYQNSPNPFREMTLISFNLPEANEVKVTISDAAGQTLRVVTGDYAAGYNTIQLTKSMLQGASGVLTYTVASGKHQATRQMIVVQ